MQSADQVWWKQVPNVRLFTETILKNLSEEKSVLLYDTQSLPWRQSFESRIMQSMKTLDSAKAFEKLSDIDEPGQYILNHYCKAEKRAQYRPSKSYAAFLAENDDIVLHERYLWVVLASVEQLQAWTDFASEYVRIRGRQNISAVFILEWPGKLSLSRKKGIVPLALENDIGEYDWHVFAAMMASASDMSSFMKSYLAELAVSLTQADAELCSQCILRNREFLQEPFAVLDKLTRTTLRSDGSAFFPVKTEAEISRCIWQAQIRILYPMLEEYRERFVRKYGDVIRAKCPIDSPFGEVYHDPADVELGTLVYMAGCKSIQLSSEEYAMLKAFRDARNTLSHLGILNFCEIEMLMRAFAETADSPCSARPVSQTIQNPHEL